MDFSSCGIKSFCAVKILFRVNRSSSYQHFKESKQKPIAVLGWVAPSFFSPQFLWQYMNYSTVKVKSSK